MINIPPVLILSSKIRSVIVISVAEKSGGNVELCFTSGGGAVGAVEAWATVGAAPGEATAVGKTAFSDATAFSGIIAI